MNLNFVELTNLEYGHKKSINFNNVDYFEPSMNSTKIYFMKEDRMLHVRETYSEIKTMIE